MQIFKKWLEIRVSYIEYTPSTKTLPNQKSVSIKTKITSTAA